MIQYSKTYLKRPLKKRQNKDLNDKWKLISGRKYCRMPLKNRQNKDLNDKINGSLMKVESIAECSKGSILQYFRPALSDNGY